MDAQGRQAAALYLYDFASGGFFYTGAATFPFPYLYDFGLGARRSTTTRPNVPPGTTRRTRATSTTSPRGQIITK